MQTPLPPGEAHVWYVRVDRSLTADLRMAGMALLAPEELHRYEKLRVERSRTEFLVKRALVRRMLSRYTCVDPQDWKFTRSSHGRPEIDAPAWARGLSFNLSSTQGLAACAVTRDHTIGLDVEPQDRWDSSIGAAARWFAPQEVEDLTRRRSEDRRRRFVEYWTLKEAYVKARGLGLSLPLHDFAFSIRSFDKIEIGFEPRLVDESRNWQFALLRLPSPHLLAIAINRPQGHDVQIVLREVSPDQL